VTTCFMRSAQTLLLLLSALPPSSLAETIPCISCCWRAESACANSSSVIAPQRLHAKRWMRPTMETMRTQILVSDMYPSSAKKARRPMKQ